MNLFALTRAGWLVRQLGNVLVPLSRGKASGCSANPLDGVRPMAVPPSAVTIDPPTNDWTLPECVTDHETVTVHVPKSGVPPKADVYLTSPR
jgi:hypothetical protein